MPLPAQGARLAAGVAAVGAAILIGFLAVRTITIAPERMPVSRAPKPVRHVAFDTLGRGESVGELMAANGLPADAIHAISGILHDYKPPRTLRPGTVLRFAGAPGADPDRVRVLMNPDSILHLAGSDSGWVARLEVVPIRVDTMRLSGMIESSLWAARLGGDTAGFARAEFQELVYDLADVFAWKIDFTREIQPGDGFRVVLEREVRPDGTTRSRRFLAIELRARDRTWLAFPYARPGGRIAWFDEEGRALRGAFLRYPVPYRITSGFTHRRYHPVLRRNRPHQGVDYGAPHGARVQATGGGTVTRAGMWGAYGRAIEIRHANGVRTRYAHLSSISAGVRPGRRVEQGQVIGRVGSTGLATGPHLHYEFIQSGRHRNPLTVSLPTEPPLERERLAEFRGQRDRAMVLFTGLRLPDPPGPTLAALPARRR